MKLFGGRILVLVSAAFIAGAFFCAYIPVGVRKILFPLLLALGIPLFIFSVICRMKRLFVRFGVSHALTVTAAVMLSFSIALGLCAVTVDRKIGIAEGFSGKEVTGVFEITGVGTNADYYSNYDAVLISADGNEVGIGVKVEFESATEFQEGDVITAVALLSVPEENLYGYDLRDAYIADGIYLIANSDPSTVKTEGNSGKSIMYYVRYVHKVIASAFDSMFDGRDSGINKALLIGDKSDLTDSFTRDIKRLGLSHLLALSGMHLSIVIGGAERFLTFIRVPKKLRYLLMIPAIVFYCAITGFSGSVLRAGVMLIIYYAAFMFSRRYDSMTALFFSVAVIIAVSPSSARDVGLMLSFITMLSIVTLSAPVSGYLNRIGFIKRLPGIIGGVLTSAVYMTVSGFFAMLFALPVMWLYFTEASLVGVLLNLLISPLIEVLMFLGVLAFVFGFVPPVSWFIAEVNIRLSEFICTACGYFSRMRNITVSLEYPFTGVIFTAMLIGFVLILMLCSKRRILYCTVIGLSAILIFGGCVLTYRAAFDDGTHVVYVTHKNSETLSVISNGKTILCDISNGGYTSVKKTIYALKNTYSMEMEGYMITHYHKLHISTFSRLTNNEIVRSIWLPYPQNDNDREVYCSLVDIAKDRGCDVYVYPLGNEVLFEEVGITLLRDMIPRSTHPIIGMMFENEDGGLAYMSSSFWEGEESLVNNITERGWPILGGLHGPKIKSETDIDFIELPEADGGIYYMILSDQGNS